MTDSGPNYQRSQRCRESLAQACARARARIGTAIVIPRVRRRSGGNAVIFIVLVSYVDCRLFVVGEKGGIVLLRGAKGS